MSSKLVTAAVGTALLSSLAYAKVEYVPGEMIVKLKKGTAKRFFARKFMKSAVKRQIPVSFGDFFVMKANTSPSMIKTAWQNFKSMPEVEYAEPNFIYRFADHKKDYLATIHANLNSPEHTYWTNSVEPSDPKFQWLWGMKNTGANEPSRDSKGGMAAGTPGADIDAIAAWEKYGKGSRNVVIAVIDTGIDYTHPDLAANIWVNEAEANGKPGVDDDGNGFIDDIHGYDFVNNDADPIDDQGHGSHCAGTIGAVHDNGEGVAGVMGHVQMMPLKFLSASGSGSTEGAIKAIEYATMMNVDIMSNSWGGGGYSEALKEAIEHARDKGIYFIAAAGNSNTDNDQSPHYPSNYEVDNVISVAAHTAQDTQASFSCYGKRTVHVEAPGHNIMSTVPGNKYAVYSGTSMATPHVSGMMGMLVAVEGRIPQDQAVNRATWTTVPVGAYRGKTISGGRMNLKNLLDDYRPERNEPNPANWEDYTLPQVWESEHPYANSANMNLGTITVPGAKFIRLVVTKLDMEPKYDFVVVKNKAGQIVEKLGGAGENVESDYVEGDTLVVDFTSDYSVNKWGFLIEKVQVQY